MTTSVVIDRITNSIEHVVTGERLDTDVLRLTKLDMKAIVKKHGWLFDWKKEYKEPGRQLFKLVIHGNAVIQGLVSLQLMETYIEMHLIENASHNIGKSKHYVGVAGNLVAFACKMSFESGFEGFVAFTAKTTLISHYSTTLGAISIFKDRMTIPTDSAKKLVNSYYKNYFYEE